MIYIVRFIESFFYYPILGGAILAVVFAAIRRLAERLFAPNAAETSDAAFAFSHLVPVLLTIAATWRGYSIFVPFEPSAPFVPTLGTLVAFAVAANYRTIKTPRRRFVFSVAAVALGYPFFGFWALFGALLTLVCELNENKRAAFSKDANPAVSKNGNLLENKKLRVELILLATLALPLCWSWFAFYRRVRFADVFWTPTFEPRLAEKWPFANASAHAGWSVLLATSFLAPLVANRISRRAPLTTNDVKNRRRRLVSSIIFAVAVAFSVVFSSFGDGNFFAHLACGRPLEREDWSKILQIEATVPRPSVSLVGLRNLALFETGSLGEKAFERPVDGTRTARLEIFAPQIALSFGRINVATRLATNSFVASDEQSASFLKTLCVAELAAGNDELARDYLGILDKTLFHWRWARDYRRRLDGKNAVSPLASGTIAEQIDRIRLFKPSKDVFVVEFPNAVFLDGLSDAPWETSTPRALEIRLTNLLARRDLQAFALRLEELAKRSAPDAPFATPKHFQEAYLLAKISAANRNAETQIVIVQSVADSFEAIRRFRSEPAFPTPEGRRQLFDRFGKPIGRITSALRRRLAPAIRRRSTRTTRRSFFNCSTVKERRR